MKFRPGKGQVMVEYLLVAVVVIAAFVGSRWMFQKALGARYDRIARVVASPAP